MIWLGVVLGLVVVAWRLVAGLHPSGELKVEKRCLYLVCYFGDLDGAHEWITADAPFLDARLWNAERVLRRRERKAARLAEKLERFK